MQRRDFLRALAATAVGMTGTNICGLNTKLFAQPSKDSAKPNILFIFADDQCYETLAAIGNTEIQTPNLDRLIHNGVLFTRAYNQGSWTGAVCVASRSMLNTGRFVWNAHDVVKDLPAEAAAGRMWAPIMKNAGYETYMTGKWHVKIDAEEIFDHTTHIRAGMPRQTKAGYNRPIEGQPDKWSPSDPNFGGYWEGGKHWSEVLGDDSIDFIKQASKKDTPFFMYLAFNAPHDPRQSPKEYVDKYPLGSVKVPENFIPEYPDQDYIGCGKKLRDERLAPFPRTEYAVKVNRQEYYAIITHMDAQVGRILDALEKSGKADNTYIFFTADHGLAIGHHGLIGKQNMYEDSLRVPLIVNGPGIPKNKKLDMPVYLQDIMPSTIELAGIKKPDYIQFNSLLPLIKGQKQGYYDALYGGYLTVQRMVEKGDYKMIMYPKIKKFLLYNVKADPMEMKNIAADPKNKPIIADLFRTFLQLQKQTGDDLAIDISEYSAKGTYTDPKETKQKAKKNGKNKKAKS